MNRFLMLLILLVSFAAPAFAVLPDEVLADPALEERARDISEGLRCLVCQNQSIDDSDADLARDLRIVVRERLVAGDSDSEVIDFVVARYGEFVLLQPTFSGHNLILWMAAPVIFVIGLLVVLSVLMRRRSPAPHLSDDEAQALTALMDDEDQNDEQDQTRSQSKD